MPADALHRFSPRTPVRLRTRRARRCYQAAHDFFASIYVVGDRTKAIEALAELLEKTEADADRRRVHRRGTERER